jgi:hypothetical protein
MTIEEKRAALKAVCRSHHPHCFSNGVCPLYGKTRNRSCTADDADVETNYNIVFGNKAAENEPTPEKETVNHPAHYQGKHECIDEMIALFGVEAVKHFCMCNVYKYRYRAANKNGQEDLDKADWYMDKLMELEEQHD